MRAGVFILQGWAWECFRLSGSGLLRGFASLVFCSCWGFWHQFPELPLAVLCSAAGRWVHKFWMEDMSLFFILSAQGASYKSHPCDTARVPEICYVHQEQERQDEIFVRLPAPEPNLVR